MLLCMNCEAWARFYTCTAAAAASSAAGDQQHRVQGVSGALPGGVYVAGGQGTSVDSNEAAVEGKSLLDLVTPP